MKFEEFAESEQVLVGAYGADYPLWYNAGALASEGGEVFDQVKKAFRDDPLSAELGADRLSEVLPERRDKIMLELGDVAFYFVRTANKAGISFEEIFESQIVKLNEIIKQRKTG